MTKHANEYRRRIAVVANDQDADAWLRSRSPFYNTMANRGWWNEAATDSGVGISLGEMLFIQTAPDILN